MVSDDPKELLLVEPEGAAAQTPIVDKYTRMVTAAVRISQEHPDPRRAGAHPCTGRDCTAVNKLQERWLPKEKMTIHGLVIHYIACHRPDVGEEWLRVIEALPYGEADPTEPEVLGLDPYATGGLQAKPEEEVYRG